jgi:heme-degrading monooxygenase HmoA
MFVMMADIQLKEDTEDNFKTLFSESNKILSLFPGFVSRKFLKSNDGGYRIITFFYECRTCEKNIYCSC